MSQEVDSSVIDDDKQVQAEAEWEKKSGEAKEVKYLSRPHAITRNVPVLDEQEEVHPDTVGTDPIVFTTTGMSISPDCTYEKWKTQGAKMKSVIDTIEKHIQWWIGDWIIWGQQRFPDAYTQALDKWMFEYGHARNCVYVCRNVPRENRTPTLSFNHHYAVAKLSVEDQKKWLARADYEGWTVSEMRKAMAGEVDILKPIPIPEIPQPPEPKEKKMVKKVVEKWKDYEEFEINCAHAFHGKSLWQVARLGFEEGRKTKEIEVEE